MVILAQLKQRLDRFNMFFDNKIEWTALNGYKWCKPTEHLFEQCVWTVDPQDGTAIFGEEFPFNEMNIDPNKKLVFAKWNGSFILEPVPIIIQQYHDTIWLPERQRKLELFKQNKICIQCDDKFNNEQSLRQHSESKGNHSKRFDKRTYYPSKEPICRCSICSKQPSNNNIN